MNCVQWLVILYVLFSTTDAFFISRTTTRSSLAPSSQRQPRKNLVLPNDSNDKDSSSPQSQEEMQNELNVMMGVNSTDDDDVSLELYNAAPLFTGVIVTIFTLLLTGYGIYAGITGDDPLMGHPKV